VIDNPLLELIVHLRANLVGNLAEGAGIKFGGTVVCVEPFNAKSRK
jgi:hypothetical protein